MKKLHHCKPDHVLEALHDSLGILHTDMQPWHRTGTAARAIYSYCLNKRLGFNTETIAQMIGWESRSTVSHAIADLVAGKYDDAYDYGGGDTTAIEFADSLCDALIEIHKAERSGQTPTRQGEAR